MATKSFVASTVNLRLSITHVFWCVLFANSVLPHKEGYNLVSTLDFFAENIMKKGKSIELRPKNAY